MYLVQHLTFFCEYLSIPYTEPTTQLSTRASTPIDLVEQPESTDGIIGEINAPSTGAPTETPTEAPTLPPGYGIDE